MYKIQIEQFEGPLDLLLELIEKEKLDITKVSLAQVTDDYIRFINQDNKVHTFELADFLLVASRLIYIKSKALLPYLVIEDEEGQSLEDQLKIYREYFEASKVVASIISKKRFVYVKERLPVTDLGFQPPNKVNASQLANIFRKVLNALEPIVNIPKEIIRKTISIQDKIEHLRMLISEKARVGFHEFLRKSKTKMEAVVSFLALLELIKQRAVEVDQAGLFGEIEVKKL